MRTMGTSFIVGDGNVAFGEAEQHNLRSKCIRQYSLLNRQYMHVASLKEYYYLKWQTYNRFTYLFIPHDF